MSRTDHHVPLRHRAQRDLPPSRFGRLGLGRGRGRGRNSMAVFATGMERQTRAELRAFLTDLVATHRAGRDVDRIVEPDPRPRHRAHWYYW